MKLILASGSPRRRELLTEVGIPFTVAPAEFDESSVSLQDPAEGVCALALGKARASRRTCGDDNAVYLGADTVVVLDGEAMGKPADEDDAFLTLRRLSGRAHSVYTSVALISGDQEEIFYEKTDVYFYELSDEEIREYIATGEPMDKAGSYGIQGRGRLLIRKIDGDYFTVVGLPVARVARALKKYNVFSL